MINKSILNFNFIILCPERNLGGLKSTVSSIRSHWDRSPIHCIVGDNIQNDELKEFQSVCSTQVGGNTITSLMNKGMEVASGWCMYVFAGVRVPSFVIKKINYFAQENKDILFALVDRRKYFYESTINGLTVHKDTFDEVGPFLEKSPFDRGDDIEGIKLEWAGRALDAGCRFKAICASVC